MFLILCCLALANQALAGRLSVHGTHFMKDGKRVFLSGANLAYIHYGYDFGNHLYAGTQVQTSIEKYIRELSASGGNSMRVWVHIEGAVSPQFDHNGRVTGLDSGGTFLSDIKSMLHYAAQHNVLIFLCLWNGAVKQNYHYRLNGLIVDTTKLQTYLDHALIPMVRALKDNPGLGGWDIMNEPEGELIPNTKNSDPCFDTTALHNQGPGWAGKLYNYNDLLRFINWQAAAIKSVDPHALVTVGINNPKSSVNMKGFFNHYSDHCLIRGGGKSQGVLDFYQYHSYDWQGHWDEVAPFQRSASAYNMHKPIVIGEFMPSGGAGMSIEAMFQYAYNHGYTGAWSWQAIGTKSQDNWTVQKRGMHSIAHNHDANKGLVRFHV